MMASASSDSNAFVPTNHSITSLIAANNTQFAIFLFNVADFLPYKIHGNLSGEIEPFDRRPTPPSARAVPPSDRLSVCAAPPAPPPSTRAHPSRSASQRPHRAGLRPLRLGKSRVSHHA
jgi:hypothetical protein